MNSDESRAKHRGRTVMAVLFLPWTWLGWLVFLGLIIFLASELAPYSYGQFGFLAGSAVLIGAAMVHFWPERRKDQRFWVLRASFKVVGLIAVAVGGVIWAFVIFLVSFFFGTWALAALVTNGNQGSIGAFSDSWGSDQFDPVFLLAIVWVLVGVPHRLFKSKIDNKLDVQSILLRLITAVASVTTGAYILLLHFDDGPLSKLNLGPLIIGTMLTVVLLAPAYKSLARGCWRNGISGMFGLSPQWDEALTELKKSRNKAIESRRAASNESGLEVRDTIHGAP
jgi:hypothetical protein